MLGDKLMDHIELGVELGRLAGLPHFYSPCPAHVTSESTGAMSFRIFCLLSRKTRSFLGMRSECFWSTITTVVVIHTCDTWCSDGFATDGLLVVSKKGERKAKYVLVRPESNQVEVDKDR